MDIRNYIAGFALILGALAGMAFAAMLIDEQLHGLGVDRGVMIQRKQDCEATISRNHRCAAVVYFEETQEVNK